MARIREGLKVGDWTITQYTPVKIDDFGSPNGGYVKLVNKETEDAVEIQNDNALRGALWWVSLYRKRVQDKNLMKVISDAVSHSKSRHTC